MRSRKRQRLSEEIDAASDAAVVAEIPLNDLHHPEPTGQDPDRDVTLITPSSKERVRNKNSSSLFVRGLGPEVTSQSLADVFSQSFLLKHAVVVSDPATKQSRGYGFVTLADPEDISRAKDDLDGTRLDGKKLRVTIAEPRNRVVEEDLEHQCSKRSRLAPEALEAKAKREQEKQARGQRAQAPPKLIVRNLPFGITDPEELAVLFRGYGKVKYSTLPKNAAGKPTGFGFITLRGRKNAENALAGVNGKIIDGRILAVDWAVEKEIWQGQNRDQLRESQSPEIEDLAPKLSDNGDGDVEDGDVAPATTPEHDLATGVESVDEEIGSSEDEAVAPSDDTTGTVFVRNLPFTVTDNDLYEHFRSFGPLRYARVVMDHSTGYSRGSGFVCFHKKDDAIQCCLNAPRDPNSKPQTDGPRMKPKPSLLENPAADTDGRYTLEGRVLNVARAVNKSEATRLSTEGKEAREKHDKDKRRLFLLSEGTIAFDSPLFASIPPSERQMREESAKQRQALIKSNPSLHMSLTRLSVRNIPRSITSKDLKQLAREAVVGFATDVKAGGRAPLSKEELARGGEAMKEAEHTRKAKGKGIVSQANVIFESREGSKVSEKNGAGRSRGYGFIEYATHRSALMGLRYLNGHLVEPKADNSDARPANTQDQSKRLIVEFAIENAQVVARRRDRQDRSRRRPLVGSKENLSGSSIPTPYNRAPSATQTNDKTAGTKRKRNADDAVVEQPSMAAAAADDANEREKKRQRNHIIGRKRAKRRRTKS